jgi:hypothetical protein
LFDEQRDSLDTHNMVFMFKYVQGCMNVYFEMHGEIDKPIVSISFQNNLRSEEVEQEQKALVREA